MAEKREYRVVSKREGDSQQKVKVYARRATAEKRVRIMTRPDPWVEWGDNPDAVLCCNGRDCGCNGATVKDEAIALRERLPALLYVRIEEREVGEWRPVPAPTEGEK